MAKPLQPQAANSLLQALVMGPAMIYTATRKEPPVLLSVALILVGAGTVLYHAKNFYDQSQQGE